VKVSFVEIYREKIRDLLNPNKDNLQIRQNTERGVYIADVTENDVKSEDQIYESLEKGNSARAVTSTKMNDESSRSHSCFILTVTTTNSADFTTKAGKLYLVDLAGSEKVGKTGATG